MIPPGVTIFCDPALAPAMRQLDPVSRRNAGAPVAVLSAPAALMLAQITRHTRNDVLFTLSAAMDQAVQLGLVKPETRIDGFSNPLVLAGLAGRVAAPPSQAALITLISGAKLAATDATPASGLDGRAILEANGLTRAAGSRVIGAANTGDAAFLVTTGAADFGLIYMTDVKADPRLTVIATLNVPPALTACSGAVNAKAVSPNAQAFLNLLRGDEAKNNLRKAGLGVPA